MARQTPRRRRRPTPVTGGLIVVVILLFASGAALENGSVDVAQWGTIAALTALALLPVYLLVVRLCRLSGGLAKRLRAWRERQAT